MAGLMDLIGASAGPNAMYNSIMQPYASSPQASQPMVSQKDQGVDDNLLAEAEAILARANKAQADQWMAQHPGTGGAAFSQAPIAQAAPIQSLMNMIGQGGPQQQTGGSPYQDPYITSLMSRG